MSTQKLQAEIDQLLNTPWDLVRRTLLVRGYQLELSYLRGLVKEERLDEAVIRPFTELLSSVPPENKVDLFSAPTNIGPFFTSTEAKMIQRPEEAVNLLLEGWTLVGTADSQQITALFLPGWTKRQPKEPEGEKTLRGPRTGFTEDLLENVTLIRRWIKDPSLRVEEKVIGRRTRTKVVLVYLADLAPSELIQEVNKRLEAVEIDAILESGYLEELITDERLTVFPLIQGTERPDKVTAALLEGRAALLVDQSPTALIMPVTINELYQSPEDYYLGYWLGSLLRLVRLAGNNLTILLPGLYIALLQVNPELLPTHLLLNISGLRAGIPFPLIVEVVFIAFALEIFFESSIRMPQPIASVGGVVTGIVLGYATIQAGLVSSPTLVVMIIATLSLYSGPNYEVSIAWRILKYFLLLGGALFGVFGLTLFAVLILAHTATLQSFGVSYLAPWAPLQPEALVDGPLRKPLWLKKRHFSTYRPVEKRRQGNTRRKDSPSGEGGEGDER